MTPQSTTLPVGWVATAVGGALGAFSGGALGFAAGLLYAETYQNDGLEGLVTMFFTTLGAGIVGAALGAFTALKWKGHERPVLSALLFTAFGSVILVGFGFLGQMKMDAGVDAIATIAGCTLTPTLAAITARKVAVRKS